MRAPYAVGAPTTGGNIVATNLPAASFVEALANALAIQQTGPTILSGLVGNTDITRRASCSQAYWVTEGQAITESEGNFDKVQLRPKQVGALSTMSRLMIQQGTPDIEMLVRADLMTILSQAIDYATLFGTSTNGHPLGLFNHSGVGTYAMGTNSGALADLDPRISLCTRVATANADASAGSIGVNKATCAVLMKLKISYGEYLFSVEGSSPSTVPNLFGNKIVVSNQLPSNLFKGTATSKCSAAIFGDFRQLVMGMW